MNLRNFSAFFFLHFFVTFTKITERKFSGVGCWIFTYFPECHSSNGVDSDIALYQILDRIAHLNHCSFFRFGNLSTSTDSNDQMHGFDNRDKIYTIFESNIHFFYQIFPDFSTDIKNFTKIELFKIVLFLEASWVNWIGCHIFYWKNIFVPLFFLASFLAFILSFFSFGLLFPSFFLFIHDPQNC